MFKSAGGVEVGVQEVKDERKDVFQKRKEMLKKELEELNDVFQKRCWSGMKCQNC